MRTPGWMLTWIRRSMAARLRCYEYVGLGIGTSRLPLVDFKRKELLRGAAS